MKLAIIMGVLLILASVAVQAEICEDVETFPIDTPDVDWVRVYDDGGQIRTHELEGDFYVARIVGKKKWISNKWCPHSQRTGFNWNENRVEVTLSNYVEGHATYALEVYSELQDTILSSTTIEFEEAGQEMVYLLYEGDNTELYDGDFVHMVVYRIDEKQYSCETLYEENVVDFDRYNDGIEYHEEATPADVCYEFNSHKEVMDALSLGVDPGRYWFDHAAGSGTRTISHSNGEVSIDTTGGMLSVDCNGEDCAEPYFHPNECNTNEHCAELFDWEENYEDSYCDTTARYYRCNVSYSELEEEPVEEEPIEEEPVEEKLRGIIAENIGSLEFDPNFPFNDDYLHAVYRSPTHDFVFYSVDERDMGEFLLIEELMDLDFELVDYDDGYVLVDKKENIYAWADDDDVLIVKELSSNDTHSSDILYVLDAYLEKYPSMLYVDDENVLIHDRIEQYENILLPRPNFIEFDITDYRSPDGEMFIVGVFQYEGDGFAQSVRSMENENINGNTVFFNPQDDNALFWLHESTIVAIYQTAGSELSKDNRILAQRYFEKYPSTLSASEPLMIEEDIGDLVYLGSSDDEGNFEVARYEDSFGHKFIVGYIFDEELGGEFMQDELSDYDFTEVDGGVLVDDHLNAYVWVVPSGILVIIQEIQDAEDTSDSIHPLVSAYRNRFPPVLEAPLPLPEPVPVYPVGYDEDVKLIGIPISRGWNMVPVSTLRQTVDWSPITEDDFSYLYFYTGTEYFGAVNKDGQWETITPNVEEPSESDFMASMWVYAEDDGLLVIDGDDRELHQLPSTEFQPGWNFAYVTPAMIGHSLYDVASQCTIVAAYSWDQDIQDWQEYDLYSALRDTTRVGAGYVINVQNQCRLEVVHPAPPALPEEPELDTWVSNIGLFELIDVEEEEYCHTDNLCIEGSTLQYESGNHGYFVVIATVGGNIEEIFRYWEGQPYALDGTDKSLLTTERTDLLWTHHNMLVRVTEYTKTVDENSISYDYHVGNPNSQILEWFYNRFPALR